MSRLTEYHCGVAVIKDKKRLKDAMHKLANYEDLEEQSLLWKLPCAVGTKVYFLNRCCGDGDSGYEIASGIFSYSWMDFPRDFYLTKAEAEKEIKEYYKRHARLYDVVDDCADILSILRNLDDKTCSDCNRRKMYQNGYKNGYDAGLRARKEI